MNILLTIILDLKHEIGFNIEYTYKLTGFFKSTYSHHTIT